ncbi:sulfite exporter TauE/SafE family protein [Flavobacterium urocaniciphilum]|uniref:Probable membrane transporter protein n=1 Tax=Flavobacterium urocaniciphilum TaxID=1299341 RepID=A0A1H9CQB1_9FLAO|nr:TSUP family transporter [Flavobacterium urocaniciphilum]SEQ03344.1 hypothetical protein SAMN05444005_10520 [Flavobacterium urocaniciphilum]
MNLLELFAQHDTTILFIIAFASLFAGFIDAIVGGGGLIQFPAFMILFPNSSIPTAFGTNKIAGLSGTSIAAVQYAKRIKFNWKLLAITATSSFLFSFIGAKLVSIINVNFLKPFIFFVLIAIAIYTFKKKDFGTIPTKKLTEKKKYLFGLLLGILIGFYDGFLGPGTGSFLVLGFVALLGFEFLEASAYAKVINCVTNVSALYVFISQGNYIIEIALIMAVSNVIGSIIGSRMAILKGNEFIRKIFLFVVCIMIIRYGYDVWC